MNEMNAAHFRTAGASVNRAWLNALAAVSACGGPSGPTLGQIVEDIAERSGDAPALISETASLDYRQLARLSNRYAKWALAEGVASGGVVGLMMRNRPDYLAIWLGITRVGGVVALLNPHLAGPALAHCVNIAAPRHVIVDADAMGPYAAAVKWIDGAPRLWGHGDFANSSVRIDKAIECYSGEKLDAAEFQAPFPSDRALLIYTSGTTGRPKAANVSHRRIVTWSKWFAGLMQVGPSDRMYDCLPLCHSVGGIVAPGAMLASGGSVVLREKFSAMNFWSDIAQTECTLFQYIGELCRYLLGEPKRDEERNHKLRLCCGNGLRADVWTKFQERFRIPRILEFYAATEGNFSLFNVEGRIGAIGRVPPFLAHRFPVALVKFDPATGAPARDGDGCCARTGADEAGEAICRIGEGEGILGRFEGYSDPAETERKILRNVFEPGDAWLRTGDLMRRDARGFYYFVDRIGDTFRWKGENVATLEIEEALCGCDGVVEAAVYGVTVAHCDGRAGMAALVVDENFDVSVLRKQVEARLPNYACPVFLRLRKALATTDTFKHRKSDLAAEGLDPRAVADPLFAFDRAQGAYVVLDDESYEAICAGRKRL